MIACALFFLLLLPNIQMDSNFQDAAGLYDKGQYAQAASVFRKLADASPVNPEIRLWLARSYLKSREWDKAVYEMEKAVQLQPSNARYHLWLGRACGERASHSVFIKALGWARRVVKEFETAKKLDPENLDVRFDLLEYYLEAPGIVGGGREKAEAEAQVIARLNPEKGFSARASIYSKDKKWDLAKKELLQAVAGYPQSISAYKDLSAFLLDRNDYEDALGYAKKALLLNGQSKRVRLLISSAKIRLKIDLDEVGGTLQELAAGTLSDGDPSFEEVYFWLGEYWLLKGARVKAREAYRTALTYNPDFSKAKDSLAKAK